MLLLVTGCLGNGINALLDHRHLLPTTNGNIVNKGSRETKAKNMFTHVVVTTTKATRKGGKEGRKAGAKEHSRRHGKVGREKKRKRCGG
jgi:hypothetical protein